MTSIFNKERFLNLTNLINYYTSMLATQIFPNKKNENWRYSDIYLLNYKIIKSNNKCEFIENISKKILNIIIYDNFIIVDKNDSFIIQNNNFPSYFICDKYFDNQYQILTNLINLTKILSFTILKNTCIKIKFKTTANQNILILLDSEDHINLKLNEEFDICSNSTINYILKSKYNNFSNIQHLRFNLSSGAILYSSNINLKNKSKYYRYAFNFNSISFREYLKSNLYYKSQAFFFGITSGYNNEIYDNIIETNHFGNKSQSLQKYFQVLNELSSSFFYGKIFVKEKLKKIIAHQLNRNIILNDYVTSFSRPELNINSDDINCSHGATFTNFHIDYINYFKNRGIPKYIAIKIIIEAFLMEIILNLKIDNKERFTLKDILNKNI